MAVIVEPPVRPPMFGHVAPGLIYYFCIARYAFIFNKAGRKTIDPQILVKYGCECFATLHQ